MSVSLDDLEGMRALDASSMLQQIIGLPDHLRSALDGKVAPLSKPKGIAICGMGGSAVGGDIMADHAVAVSDVPVCVVRGVELPRWVSNASLVVMVSYSGNTWEVLDLYERAKERSCHLVSVTSGGRLMELSEADGIPIVRVPKGLQPRAALGYLLGAEGAVLDAAGLSTMRKDLSLAQLAMADLRMNLSPGVPSSSNMAKKTALKLKGRIPVVYAPRNLRTVAYRWQTQINENSKMMAFSGEFPEMNHNQIVGWAEGQADSGLLPVFLKPVTAKGNLGEKMEVAMQLIREAKVQPLAIELSGRTTLESALMGIMLGDFVSFYLAMLKGVDPTPVSSIEELKRRMR
ncbi:MAG: bifunctional phosphoglucose/phosphomannose isomerase [Methanomassiliicoccales archaeon]|jgi:glucose/mannose-6-phosphate isomerase|nr:bifunctional phosphoglucose/phosphomannose isomerase [Methanomassiliicoccales archaeon]